MNESLRFLRYPGGKQRLLGKILMHLPASESVSGRFVEPFVGGGAIFFAFNPARALLADLNSELIDLYRGLRRHPKKVWTAFRHFPSTKKGYYKVRDMDFRRLALADRAARTLYLNRTCFKGMWRHNALGKFNVGYGGQARRWVVNRRNLIAVSKRLRKTSLRASDFEDVIEQCVSGDFLFLDPPYRPGGREMTNDHYVYSQFAYKDHRRLALSLKKATRKGIRWAMTTSAHPDIMRLFRGNRSFLLPKGTGKSPGILATRPREVLVCNYDEEMK